MPDIVKCDCCGFVYERTNQNCSRCGERAYTTLQEGKDRV